jgi:hypothetical protein
MGGAIRKEIIMWCNQTFSLIKDDTIQNIIVADDYEIANRLARDIYGAGAIAVDTTLYPVSIGYKYKDGIFLKEDGETVINRNPSAEEEIASLKTQNEELLKRLDKAEAAIKEKGTKTNKKS